jgi:reverse gyrase
METSVKKKFEWDCVWQHLRELAEIDYLPSGERLWRASQEKSLHWIARQLQNEPGVLIADEVGLGKTRLAIALAVCVAACGGRVAILIPPGLTYQWCNEELRGFLKQLEVLNLPRCCVPTRICFKERKVRSPIPFHNMRISSSCRTALDCPSICHP